MIEGRKKKEEKSEMAWWLSWLERRPVTAEVVGSNPIRVARIGRYGKEKEMLDGMQVINTSCLRQKSKKRKGILAQLGEHLPYKQRVIGSSPIGPIGSGNTGPGRRGGTGRRTGLKILRD